MSSSSSTLSLEERARRRAQRMEIARHAAEQLECCWDATSLVDWGVLRRYYPQGWARVLRDCFRVEPEPGNTLGEYLSTGAGGLLLPKNRLDTTAQKKRKAARHVAEVLGHLPLEELDEEGLAQARWHYVAALGGRQAHALITHDLRILRQAVERGREALGMPAEAHAWPSARPTGRNRKRTQRGTASPREVLQLLAQLEPALKVAVVLFVGLGLRHEEVRLIRVGHLDYIQWQLRVAGNEHRGPVYRAVPFWTQLLIWEAMPRLATMPLGQQLFESPVRPGYPRTDIGKWIRAAAGEAGLVEPQGRAGRFSPQGLRRLYQAVARANDLPAALVRGSLGKGQGGDQFEVSCLAVDRALARRWAELMRTPEVGPDERPHVPVKAPKGVGRWSRSASRGVRGGRHPGVHHQVAWNWFQTRVHESARRKNGYRVNRDAEPESQGRRRPMVPLGCPSKRSPGGRMQTLPGVRERGRPRRGFRRVRGRQQRNLHGAVPPDAHVPRNVYGVLAQRDVAACRPQADRGGWNPENPGHSWSSAGLHRGGSPGPGHLRVRGSRHRPSVSALDVRYSRARSGPERCAQDASAPTGRLGGQCLSTAMGLDQR